MNEETRQLRTLGNHALAYGLIIMARRVSADQVEATPAIGEGDTRVLKIYDPDNEVTFTISFPEEGSDGRIHNDNGADT